MNETADDPLAFLDGLEERLLTPRPLPKPKAEQAKEKLATPPDLDRSREVLAQSQQRFHEEERRQLEPVWRRNRRLYGSSRPPSEEQVGLLDRQLRLDRAIEAAKERKRAEAEHLRALDEFKMGLWD